MKILKYFLVVVILLLGFLFLLFFLGILGVVTFNEVLDTSSKKTDVQFYEYPLDDENWFITPAIKQNAEAGNAGDQYVYGYMLFYGRYIPQDQEQGLELIRKSAEQNFSYAQAALAYLYFKGDDVPKDKDEARKWAEKAEKSGFPIWDSWKRWEQEEDD